MVDKLICVRTVEELFRFVFYRTEHCGDLAKDNQLVIGDQAKTGR